MIKQLKIKIVAVEKKTNKQNFHCDLLSVTVNVYEVVVMYLWNGSLCGVLTSGVVLQTTWSRTAWPPSPAWASRSSWRWPWSRSRAVRAQPPQGASGDVYRQINQKGHFSTKTAEPVPPPSLHQVVFTLKNMKGNVFSLMGVKGSPGKVLEVYIRAAGVTVTHRNWMNQTWGLQPDLVY